LSYGRRRPRGIRRRRRLLRLGWATLSPITCFTNPWVAGGLHGNAPGFVELFALITLLWVVGSGSYGVPRALGEAGSEVDDAEVDDSEPSTRTPPHTRI